MGAKFPLTVVIGRFQPFHKGHLNLIRKALTAGKRVFVLLGSATEARNAKNTWSVEERIRMMAPCFSKGERERITFEGMPDYPTDQEWVDSIDTLMRSALTSTGSIALVGYMKDETSYYLKLFPHWTFIQTEKFCEGLSATDLRHAYFGGGQPDPRYLPDPVIEFLCDFRKHPDYEKMTLLLKATTPPSQKQKTGASRELRG